MGLAGFRHRPLSYKMAFALALFSALLCVIGVSSPFWYRTSSTYVVLWSQCKTSDEDCIRITADVAKEWWKMIQVVIALQLICVTVSCSCLFFENLFREVKAPKISKDVLGIFGGGIGTTGFFMFVLKTKSTTDTIYTAFFWSLILVLLGFLGMIVAYIIILSGCSTMEKASETIDATRDFRFRKKCKLLLQNSSDVC